MVHFKVIIALLLASAAMVCVESKPSHHFGFHGLPDHLDLVPPVLPPTHFHAPIPAPLIPYNQGRFLPPAHFHTTPLVPAPAPLLPAPAPLLPAPAPFLQAPAPLLPAPVPFFTAPAPILPAPAPLLPAPVAPLPSPVIHTHADVPVLDLVPFAEPLPTYRAIPGPKTTTHHVSVGYAFPKPRFTKLHGHVHALPHAHLHAAPLALSHHHHTLF